MRKYDSYKKSGIEWIGEIPSHWEVKKGKRFIPLKNGFPFDSSKFSPFSDSGLPLVRIRDIETSAPETYYKGEVVEDAIIENGDILIGMDGDFNIAIWNGGKALLNQRVCKVEKDEIFDEKFIYYLFPKYLKVINDLTYFTTVKHLSNNDLWQVKYPLPPKTEQTAIAAYLDRKTAEIDELIADKKRLLELYEEEKTAIINELVTGKKVWYGNAWTEPVEVKDSGIEWLGEIPEHWEVKKLKHVAILKSGNSIVSEQIKESGEYPVYGGNGLRGYFSEFTHDGSHVLIGRQGAYCGNIKYGYSKFWASEHAVVVSPTVDYEIVYLGELLRTMNLGQYSVSAAQPGLAVDMIKNLFIPFPSRNEQQSIVRHIETESALINSKKSKTEKLIELLTEYRTALISEVVTGKIKVI